MKSPEQAPKKSFKKRAGEVLMAGVIASGALRYAEAQDASKLAEAAAAGSFEQAPATENEWMKLAESDPVRAFSILSSIEDKELAFRVARAAALADLKIGFSNYDRYSEIPGAKDILDEVARGLIYKDQEGAEFVFGKAYIMADAGLEKFPEYFQDAARRSRNSLVLDSLGPLFYFLPDDLARSIVNEALNTALAENPLEIVRVASYIRTYMENETYRIDQAIDYLVENDRETIYLNFSNFIGSAFERTQEKEAFFEQRLLYNDPAGIYKHITKPNGGENATSLKRYVTESRSSAGAALRLIIEAKDVPEDVRAKLPLLLDEFVRNKDFTIAKAVEVAQNPEEFQKMLAQIMRGKNPVGGVSIQEFLSSGNH